MQLLSVVLYLTFSTVIVAVGNSRLELVYAELAKGTGKAGPYTIKTVVVPRKDPKHKLAFFQLAESTRKGSYTRNILCSFEELLESAGIACAHAGRLATQFPNDLPVVIRRCCKPGCSLKQLEYLFCP
ncbi:hypothetical protein L596_010615 [Steinernema carpocapsae]|uniref:Insulin-like domain-containing protein n=1 Tax=Steinernema carpocapsae TaxID=34508 RepID=A0A4U5PJ54_STECR|nr:hypothetical protein L596_010615 [Steinernema carpocapsae]